MGAFGFWLVSKLDGYWSKPRIEIEYGSDYPFRAPALFQDGQQGEFVRVRVKNVGRSTAKRCKSHRT